MKQRYFIGESVRVRITFRDDTGAPMAATGVNLLAHRPDGQILAYAPVPLPLDVGVFVADAVATTAGTWVVRATCAGPSAAAVEAEFIVATSVFIT